jgi:hypothetical protein
MSYKKFIIFIAVSLFISPAVLRCAQDKKSSKSPTRACTFEPLFDAAFIVDALTTDQPITNPFTGQTFPPIQLQNILRQFNLYNHTYPLVIRDLHTIPTLQPLLTCTDRKWSFALEPFYNQTTKCFYTPCSSKILSYIGLLAQEDFLEIIDVDDFTNVDIPDVLSLFGQMTMEERRLGAMVQGWFQHNRWTASVALPIYYIEHNFQLTQKRKDALENAALFAGSPSVNLPGLDLDTFTNQHLVRDRAGIGDLRIQGFYDISHYEDRPVNIGLELTFPTAWTAKRGIIGGNFCKTSPIPEIDYQTIFDFYGGTLEGFGKSPKTCKLELAELVVGYGIATLDRLTSILGDSSLGLQHFKGGPVVYTTQPLCWRTSLDLYGELQWSAPHQELRFFRIKKNQLEFFRNYTSIDPVVAEANLQFLDQQSTNFLYPTAVKISTRPGMMFHINGALTTEWHPILSTTLGYDYWSQRKEKLGKISCRVTPGDPLDLCAGMQHSAREGKIFGNVMTKLCELNYDILIVLRGDLSVQNRGIGKSFTLGVDFVFDF